MRATILFLSGLAVGAAGTGLAQDQRLPGINGINHIALVTEHYDAMKVFYAQTMGFPEAFTVKDANGQPTITYFQASRNTFIEVFPAGANRTAGFQHYGVHVDDINATVERLKQRGVPIGTPRTSGTGSIIVTITDPDGTRIEFSELGPASLARKAMDAWK
jgi:catechol 2,3-dioxygenase-like lactoylglutathione lyase family enzyme